MLPDRKLADYLNKSMKDYYYDHNSTRLLRRLHIKEIHMHRTSNVDGIRIVKVFRRLI